MLTQEVVNMGQTRRAFTREFKQEAVKLVTAGGHPTAQVARDLGLSGSRRICYGAGSKKFPVIRLPPSLARDGASPTKRSSPG